MVELVGKLSPAVARRLVKPSPWSSPIRDPCRASSTLGQDFSFSKLCSADAARGREPWPPTSDGSGVDITVRSAGLPESLAVDHAEIALDRRSHPFARSRRRQFAAGRRMAVFGFQLAGIVSEETIARPPKWS